MAQAAGMFPAAVRPVVSAAPIMAGKPATSAAGERQAGKAAASAVVAATSAVGEQVAAVGAAVDGSRRRLFKLSSSSPLSP